MAQKNKVKELVGRGLHSYHTKALQQIHRIEKKNKEQNHKISILSNELDNDYLTKTEEGSVVSLEHSKEGMVYLDELQGNTLVNYCTDGSKEMTLNGDIDLEGTFVTTTTEGVDGGKVDVVCEGNTLVALASTPRMGNTITLLHPLTTGKEYTLLFTTTKQPTSSQRSCFMVWKDNQLIQYLEPVENAYYTKLGSYRIKFTAQDTHTYLGCWTQNVVGELEYSNVMLLEGDWTSRELPSYFEGMKSVGQDDTNGHKIEILSQNKNLVSELEVGGLNSGDGAENENNGVFTIRNKGYIKVEPNTTYTLSIEDNNTFEGMVFHTYDINKKQIKYNPSSKFTLTTPNNAYYLRFRSFNADATNVNTNLKIQLEKGNIRTSYVPHSINKKEILLNEPLRGLPNGVKDRFVKIGNKCYIERNIKKKVFDGTENWEIDQDTNRPNTLRCDLRNFMTDSKKIGSDKIYCDKFISIFGNSDDIEHIRNSTPDHYATIILFISKSKLTTIDADGVKEWFSKNNTTLLYQLETPIYEPLEIEPTLNTYTDVTHISNNSIIPCTMKIKNSGYNAIIKPSTLYTIALDTNKSGTIGINLGGVKGTTTNNILTLTTPATLSDDSLRLYGKGIKGSKVRLLEGDKTNWIPSHFEGMKSSFEDKLQDDGSYKMEILSNNENLFPFSEVSNVQLGIGDIISRKICEVQLRANTQYTMFRDITEGDYNRIRLYTVNTDGSYRLMFDFLGSKGRTTFISKNNETYIVTAHCFNQDYNKITSLALYEGDVSTNDIKHQSNKIQFSSIEPLRKYDGLKFKNGQLMIERNYGELILNRENYLKYELNSDTPNYLYVWFSIPNLKYEKKDNIIANISEISFDNRFKIDIGLCYYRIPISFKNQLIVKVPIWELDSINDESIKRYIESKNLKMVYELTEPTYEEIPFELQKIILEGYENGTLFFDTNIPPTSTTTYAGETPIVKATKLNKTEVLNNTNDINDNIIPYLMDMDYRVVCLQLQSENINDGVSMARLFGGTYEMLKRDIQSKRYSIDEYRHRLDAYLGANKITEDEYNKLGDMLNE